MERIYSDNLMKKAKALLEEKSGRILNDDEVEIMLDRMSRLGMIFIKGALDKQNNDQKNEIHRKKIPKNCT
ncbi:MAG: hypothetical protein P4L62_02365 [Candidatus Pacebacteria bacterium]|nr:hypothetical protein [Candidatus Paceibacterota bacterium]